MDAHGSGMMELKAQWRRDAERGYGFAAEFAGARLRVTATRVTVGERSYPRTGFHLVNLVEAMAFAEQAALGGE